MKSKSSNKTDSIKRNRIQNELPAKSKKMSPIVFELAGIAKKKKFENLEKEYTGYLIEKYE
jgi:hypothetical protein